MSAPPLSRAGPIPDANSFYNPEPIPQATSVIGNATSPTSKRYTLEAGEFERGAAIQIPIDLNYVSTPYISEDARVIQLYGKLSRYPTLKVVDSRELDQLFKRLAGGTPSDAYIATQMVTFLPSITQGLIELVRELQEAKVGHSEINQLQRNQDAFQTRDNMRGYIGWLQGYLSWHQGENEKLQVKIRDLRDALSESEQNYTSMKAQKDSLKNALNEEATSNSGSETKSKKRRHRE